LFKNILGRLDYVDNERIVSDADLVIEAWDLLKHSGDSHIYVSLTNFVTFIIAVENLFVDQMQADPNSTKQKRKFGYFVNDRFYVECINEVRAMHSHFYQFFANKNIAVDRRKDEQVTSPELNFHPQISKRSKSLGASHKRGQTMISKMKTVSPDTVQPLSAKSIHSRDSRLREMRVERAMQEMTECTFKPNTLRGKKNFAHQ